jgi:hypothetical protein
MVGFPFSAACHCSMRPGSRMALLAVTARQRNTKLWAYERLR